MAGINYAAKYSTIVDEKFKTGPLSEPAINRDYDFTGVKTVHVYSIGTSKMNDYNRAKASNRYGDPAELEDGNQELTMTKDRSFTFTIDKGNHNDQMMIKDAGKALDRQLKEVVFPEVDTYRFSKIVEGAPLEHVATAAITKGQAYEAFLDGTTKLDDDEAPAGGRICYVSPAFYKLLKLDDSFVKASDLGQQMLIKGQIGEVDGVPIIKVPTKRLPLNVAFVITNAQACTSPTKLAEYKIHQDPPGINGWLVEGRVYYDAFILNNKVNAIYVHKTV